MRKVIVSMNVTLNGYIAGPKGELDWHYQHWGDDMARATAMQLSGADTLVLGRLTYQAMAGYWQAIAREIHGSRYDIDFAGLINRAEKVVFSNTLKNTGSWLNSRLAKQSISGEITALKMQPGKHIIVYGSGQVVAALNRLDLVDEYHLWIHPVMINKGRPLFAGAAKKLQFQHKTVFSSGVVLMMFKACRYS